MDPNWASGPQNQPNAKVAVSKFSGTAASIGGIEIDELEVVSADESEDEVELPGDELVCDVGIGFLHNFENEQHD